MRKRYLWLLPVLLLLVAYVVPTPRKTAADLYSAADRRSIDRLEAFRQLPTKTQTVGDQPYRYVVRGAGPNTILFLHGMAGAYDFWWQQVAEFSRDYRVISVTYPPVNNLADLSRGILSILDAEGAKTATVVGSSLGGYLTQYLLARHPDRVARAVLGNTFPVNDIYKERNDGQIAVARWLPEWAVMAVLRQGLRKNVIPAAQNDPLAAAQLLENTYGRMSKAQFLARYDCVIDTFQPADGRQIQTPLLILESDNDPLILPELRARLKAHYVTAQVHTFHQKGHFPYLNDSGTYNAVLRKFLETTNP